MTQEVCQHCWNVFAPHDPSHLCPECRRRMFVCPACGRTCFAAHMCFFVPFPFDATAGAVRRR